MNQGEANKLATMWQYKSRGIDDTNKVEFDKFYSHVKAKDSREVATKALREASKSIVSDTQRRGFISMMNLAVGYAEVNTVCNYSMIEWINLKRVVTFYKYVSKHHTEEVCAIVQDKLSKVYEKGMSPERYNNGLTALLDTLKEEYTVEIVKEATVEEALMYVDNVSLSIKQAMLDKLMEELGYEMEVA